MRLLLACEFYHPSRGGVQEVMRQLAERFVAAGHDVTVCTSRLPERDFASHNGVKIEEFDISGNRVNGLRGEIGRYVDFLKAFDGDAILIKAAQQWTFDAAWPALDAMHARKVFIPCGFSGLYEPAFAGYFEELPEILAKFDRLIFYAEDYRDVNFARAHGLTALSFLPNGASDIEFDAPPAPGIRKRLGIPDDALVVMTVGSPIAAKGHTELAEAFTHLDPKGRELFLVLNGRWPEPPPAQAAAGEPAVEALIVPNDFPAEERAGGLGGMAARAWNLLAGRGPGAFARHLLDWCYYRCLWLLRLGLQPFWRLVRVILRPAADLEPRPASPKSIDDHVAAIGEQSGKTVLKTNLPRSELIEAFFGADLFVFASNIEYSPLVLFEAGAAGLPYLTVPVGNADEIVRWTGGGEICPAVKDARGYTHVDPLVLAQHIQALIDDPERLRHLGEAGRASWRKAYNWGAIAPRYEAILQGGAGESADSLSAGYDRTGSAVS